VLYFENDAVGETVAFNVNNTRYLYIKNIQGNIIGISDETGEPLVYYTYDSWGKPLSITDVNGNDISSNASHVANVNPLRYRGYYWDAETGLFYVNSRYYDPETGRFINADGMVQTGQGLTDKNMFAYCGNSPINRADPSGMIWMKILGAMVNYAKNAGTITQAGMGVAVYNALARKSTPSIAPTKMSSAGVKFMTDYEGGFHSTPYDDGLGNPTIGYGHLIKSNEKFTSITEAAGRKLFAADLASFESEVASYSASLGIIWDQSQYDALVSVAFNAGSGYKQIVSNLLAGNNSVAAFTWHYTAEKAAIGNGADLGLWRRRMDEATIFMYGAYNRTSRNP